MLQTTALVMTPGQRKDWKLDFGSPMDANDAVSWHLGGPGSTQLLPLGIEWAYTNFGSNAAFICFYNVSAEEKTFPAVQMYATRTRKLGVPPVAIMEDPEVDEQAVPTPSGVCNAGVCRYSNCGYPSCILWRIIGNHWRRQERISCRRPWPGWLGKSSTVVLLAQLTECAASRCHRIWDSRPISRTPEVPVPMQVGGTLWRCLACMKSLRLTVESGTRAFATKLQTRCCINDQGVHGFGDLLANYSQQRSLVIPAWNGSAEIVCNDDNGTSGRRPHDGRRQATMRRWTSRRSRLAVNYVRVSGRLACLQITDKNITKYLEWWHSERQRARTDLVWLANTILGYPDVSERVHGPILAALQKFPGANEFHKTVGDYQAAIQGKVLWEPKCKMELLPANDGFEQSRDNLILFPRGHIKTTIVSVAHSVQWIINYPNVRILGTTATETLITSIVLEIRNHFILNDQFRLLFPELCPQSKEGKIPEFGNLSGFTVPCRDNNNKKLGPGGKEPTFLASTVGSAITGYHGDVQKSDDLVEKINSASQNGIDEVIRHAGSLGDLLEKYNTDDPLKPLKGWSDMVGTPWDFSDLYQVRRNDHAARRTKGLADALAKSGGAVRRLNWPEGPFLWPERMGYTALKEIGDDPMKGPWHSLAGSVFDESDCGGAGLD